MEQKLVSFANKILSIICGQVHDNELGYRRRRSIKENCELTEVQKYSKFCERIKI